MEPPKDKQSFPPLKVNKPKKERSPAQQAATAKALDILRAKRDAQKKAQEEEVAGLDEEKKAEAIKTKTERHKAKKIINTLSRSDEVPYITKSDFESFKNEFMTLHKPAPVPQAPVVVAPPPPVVERVVEKPIVKETVRILSGNELLDRIFFGSK